MDGLRHGQLFKARARGGRPGRARRAPCVAAGRGFPTRRRSHLRLVTACSSKSCSRSSRASRSCRRASGLGTARWSPRRSGHAGAEKELCGLAATVRHASRYAMLTSADSAHGEVIGVTAKAHRGKKISTIVPCSALLCPRLLLPLETFVSPPPPTPATAHRSPLSPAPRYCLDASTTNSSTANAISSSPPPVRRPRATTA